MSCIGNSRVLALVVSSFLVATALAEPAKRAENETATVVRLYKDFAWQALASQPELFGEDLPHQPESILRKYFTPKLAKLLVQDAACQRRTQEICKLDFDVLFDSQDPRVTDLEIRLDGKHHVTVDYTDPVSGQKTLIQFAMEQVDGTWKIGDVTYMRHAPASLVRQLTN
jgi:hypothetical protein